MRTVRVIDQSLQKILAERTEIAETWWARGKGLLGRSVLAPGAGLLIAPCNSIHSFFMRFPFDAMFLDRDLRVLHLIHSMPANRISRIVFKSWAVLELPAGVLRSTGAQPGDQLALSDLP